MIIEDMGRCLKIKVGSRVFLNKRRWYDSRKFHLLRKTWIGVVYDQATNRGRDMELLPGFTQSKAAVYHLMI